MIENLAQSDACYGNDYDRELRDSKANDQKIKEINEKLNKMNKSFLISEKQVNYMGESNMYQEMGVYVEGNEERQEEVNYLDNQGGFQGKPLKKK